MELESYMGSEIKWRLVRVLSDKEDSGILKYKDLGGRYWYNFDSYVIKNYTL